MTYLYVLSLAVLDQYSVKAVVHIFTCPNTNWWWGWWWLWWGWWGWGGTASIGATIEEAFNPMCVGEVLRPDLTVLCYSVRSSHIGASISPHSAVKHAKGPLMWKKNYGKWFPYLHLKPIWNLASISNRQSAARTHTWPHTQTHTHTHTS